MNPFSLPSGGLDPCSMGPLTCGPSNCHAAVNEDEKVTLFSAASRKGHVGLGSVRYPISRSSTNLSSNPSMNPQEALMQRVEDFQSRGWLSQQEYRQYMALLETAPFPTENQPAIFDHVQDTLIKELDALEDRMTGGRELLAKITRNAVLTPRRQKKAAQDKENGTQASFPEAPPNGTTEPLGDSTNSKNNNHSTSEFIVDPKDVSKQFSESQIEELFVETCFFARLGFVQPPCCLKCTYRESLKGAVPKPHCDRWVIWRRDASHVLHPRTMGENTILVQCHAARQLLSGNAIDSYQWNATKKVLQSPR